MFTSRAPSDTSNRPALSAGLLAILAALVALACGDTDQPWGSTVTGDRGAQPAPETAPPPTPDVRELTAASPGDGEDGDAGPDVRPLQPGDVTYPRAESLYREGEHGRALRHFSVYVEKEPDNPWGHYMQIGRAHV